MLNDKALFTPSMAEVLERQGYLKEALEIYSHLLDRMPGHPAYRNKVSDIEGRLAEGAGATDRLAGLFDEWLTLALASRRLERLKKLRGQASAASGRGEGR